MCQNTFEIIYWVIQIQKQLSPSIIHKIGVCVVDRSLRQRLLTKTPQQFTWVKLAQMFSEKFHCGAGHYDVISHMRAAAVLEDVDTRRARKMKFK